MKVLATANFPSPKTETEIRIFLGMTVNYSRYIQIYTTIVEKLTKALKGTDKSKITWNPNMKKHVAELKKKITQHPVLFAPNNEQ